MQYREYKTAGQRHIDTCEKLVKHLQNIGNDLGRLQELTRIRESTIKNIFYLSGYIIECSVFYSFFANIGYSYPTIYGRQSDIIVGSIKFENILKHFRFSRLDKIDYRTGANIINPRTGFNDYTDNSLNSLPVLNYIYNNVPTIVNLPILDFLQTTRSVSTPTSNEQRIINLARQWDPSVRYYTNIVLVETDVLDYFKSAKQIFDRLT